MPILETRRQKIIALIIILVAIPIVLSFLKLTKNKPTTTTQISQPPKLTSDLKKGIYKCPSIKQFCQTGRDIIKDNSYAGFGNFATGSAVLAAFDGVATGLTITLPSQFKSEKLNVIYLDNKENNIRAVYYFKGNPINFNNMMVKEGADLGVIGDKMQYFDTSLLFTIIKGDVQKGEKIRLTAKDFL